MNSSNLFEDVKFLIFLKRIEYFRMSSTSRHMREQVIQRISNHTQRSKQAVSLNQLNQLTQDIKSLHYKNNQLYKKIKQKNKIYEKELYCPSIPICTKQSQMGFIKQILVKQLDTLFEEQHALFKELNSDILQHDVNQFLALRQSNDPFSFLRSIWMRPNFYGNQSQNRIERIGKSVAYIKAHVQNLLKKEQLDKNKKRINEWVVQSAQYTILKEKYEKAKMDNQFYQSQAFEFTSKNETLSIENRRLNIQYDMLIEKIQKLKEKDRILENKFMKTQIRIQKIEQKNYQLEKDIKKIKDSKKYTFINNKEQFEVHIHSQKLLAQTQTIYIDIHLSDTLDFLEKCQRQNAEEQNIFNLKLNSESVLNAIGCSPNSKAKQKPLKNTFAQLGSPRNIKKLKSINETVQNELRKKRFSRQNTSQHLQVQKYKRGFSPRDLITQIKNKI